MAKHWHPYIWRTAQRAAVCLPVWYGVEDLAQDITIQLWKSGQLAHDKAPHGLVCQISNVFRQLYGRTRYKKHERSIEEYSVSYIEEKLGKPDPNIEGWIDREKVRHWVQSLPPRSRQILNDNTMRTQREIGEKYGLTEARIHQIRKDIQRSFNKRWGGTRTLRKKRFPHMKSLIGLILGGVFFGFTGFAYSQSITLNWEAGQHADGHRVEKKVDAGGYTQVADVPMPTTAHTEPATVGTAVCMRVVAYNEFGTAAPSGECCTALIPAESATGVTCTVSMP